MSRSAHVPDLALLGMPTASNAILHIGDERSCLHVGSVAALRVVALVQNVILYVVLNFRPAHYPSSKRDDAVWDEDAAVDLDPSAPGRRISARSRPFQASAGGRLASLDY